MRVRKPVYVFFVCIVLLSQMQLFAQNKALKSPISKTLKKATSSCVAFYPVDTNDQILRYATAFFVSESQIVTNLSNLQGMKDGFVILKNGKTKYKTTQIVATDSFNDLIILEISEKKGKPIDFEYASALPEEGSRVYIIGHPQLELEQIKASTITHLFDTLEQTILKLSTPFDPKSNGGMVLNSDGKIIGVACNSFANSQYISYIRPISYVLELLSEKQEPRIIKILPPDTILKTDTTFVDLIVSDTLAFKNTVASRDTPDSLATINTITDSIVIPQQEMRIDTFTTIHWLQDSIDYIATMINKTKMIGVNSLNMLQTSNERWQINDSSYFNLASIEIFNQCKYSMSDIVLLFLVYNNKGKLVNKGVYKYITPYTPDNNLRYDFTRQINVLDMPVLVKSKTDSLEIRVLDFKLHNPF